MRRCSTNTTNLFKTNKWISTKEALGSLFLRASFVFGWPGIADGLTLLKASNDAGQTRNTSPVRKFCPGLSFQSLRHNKKSHDIVAVSIGIADCAISSKSGRPSWSGLLRLLLPESNTQWQSPLPAHETFLRPYLPAGFWSHCQWCYASQTRYWKE